MPVTGTQTLRELIAITEAFLDDGKGTVYSEAALALVIRAEFNKVVNAISERAPSLLSAEVVVPWVQGTFEYALPLDFMRAMRVCVEVSGGERLELMNVSAFERRQRGSTWWMLSENLGLYLVADPGGSVILEYVQRVAPPADLDTAISLPDSMVMPIALFAVAKLRATRGFPIETIYGYAQRELDDALAAEQSRTRDSRGYNGVPRYN